MDNYRPISVLPTISKVLERVVHRKLYDFLAKEKLLRVYQCGFRKGHSTELDVFVSPRQHKARVWIRVYQLVLQLSSIWRKHLTQWTMSCYWRNSRKDMVSLEKSLDGLKIIRTIQRLVSPYILSLKIFEIKKFLRSSWFRYYIKQIDSMLPCVCSVIDHRRRQNV